MHERILVVYGTRPEAIKVAPVVWALRRRPERFEVVTCSTAQHRDMLDRVSVTLGLEPDLDLDLMRADQGLNDLAARVLAAVDRTLVQVRPDWVVVQGDTTTAMASALATFHRRVRLAHVEAGLRTGDLQSPFPEEANRLVIDRLADLLFAPTATARTALLAEGLDPERIHVTGNTVVDALKRIASGLGEVASSAEVLVTVHRRESFGAPLTEILAALATVAERFPETNFFFPVHRNPNIAEPARRELGSLRNVELVEPLDYVDLVRRLLRCRFVLTDSGGLQEEAPTFGKPVLVLRDKTERPEGIAAGVARLVGTRRERIVEEVTRLIADPAACSSMARTVQPYGDGNAGERIADILESASNAIGPADIDPRRRR